jgi:hypothetical protein
LKPPNKKRVCRVRKVLEIMEIIVLLKASGILKSRAIRNTLVLKKAFYEYLGKN